MTMRAHPVISASSAGRLEGRWVAALYFCSGIAGLAYQVLWARMLSLQFGISIFGVVISAAAFMAGLGLGALWGGRLCRGTASPLKVFAFLEGGVALYALTLPLIFHGVDDAIGHLAPLSLNGWYGLNAVAALALIALPATALGVGFPMVLRALEGTPVSLAAIYGINTCGGAVGALLPLWLLPLLGWSRAVWVMATLGLVVAAVAFWLGQRTRAVPSVEANAPVSERSFFSLSLLAYAGVGAAALMLEVGWTRLFGMLLLRTEYVMAIILAVFLVGIGVGSLATRWLSARGWIEILPPLAGGFALLSLWGLPWLAQWVGSAQFDSLAGAMLGQGFAVALLTLPVTLILGAWLPLLNRRLEGDKAHGGRLYGANSIGAALGALLAGFVLIPGLGTTTTVVLAAILLFVCGMAWAGRRMWLALPLLAALAWPVTALPPVSVLLPATQGNSVDLALQEDALAVTHVVAQADGQRLLLADLQRMDASSDPLAVVSQQNQVRLPLLLHPEPRKVLFLGLGTGISAAASLAYPDLQRTAVELSQGAIDAAGQWFDSVNDDVSNKMTIVRDDARRFLRSGDDRYDVIIGDLFHPDLVGRSALLSVQQFERARARLADGGVFAQWLALNQFDPESLAVVMRSFARVFGDGAVFIDGFRMALVGSVGRDLSAADTLGNLARLSGDNVDLATGGEGGWTWLGRYWGRIRLGDGDVQDEWAPVIEYQLPRARYHGDMDLAALLGWLLKERPRLGPAMADLGVSADQRDLFERAYAATELGLRAWLVELQGREMESQRLLRLAYQANNRDRWISGAIADRMYASLDQIVQKGMDREQALDRILQLRPDHLGALRELWHLARDSGRERRAKIYRLRLEQLAPLDAEVASGQVSG